MLFRSTCPNDCFSCLSITDFPDNQEIWTMSQGQLNQTVISHANGFVQLQLQHSLLLNLNRIFNRHNLLTKKFELSHMVHQPRIVSTPMIVAGVTSNPDRT